MPGYAPQAAFACSREQFARIEEWLDGPEAARLEHAVLEGQLARRGREMFRLLFRDHLDLRAVREQRQEVTGPGGIARTRAEAGRCRSLSAVSGQVMVGRVACRAPGARHVHPADAELGLPPGKHSHGLCRKAAAAAARGSSEQACAGVVRETGSGLGKRQCQQLARQAAADFGGFCAAGRRPPGAEPGDVLALSCDGKGIVIRPGHLRPETARKARGGPGPEQDGRLWRGEVSHRKPMAGPARCSISPRSRAPPVTSRARPAPAPARRRLPPGPGPAPATSSAPPNAGQPPPPPPTSTPKPPGWTTPPPSRPAGPSPAASSTAPAATS